MEDQKFNIKPKKLYRIRTELEAVLNQVNKFHSKTQDEFQFLHKQYIDVSRKLRLIIDNLNQFQSNVSWEDLHELIENLDRIKNKISGIDTPVTEQDYEKLINRDLQVNVRDLQKMLRKIKLSFRNDLIKSALKKNGHDLDSSRQLQLNVKNLITADLYALINILENALNFLQAIFEIVLKGGGKKSSGNFRLIMPYLEYLMNRIVEFRDNLHNNVFSIAERFEECRKTGDEIITALQYQDIFGQKMVHVIDIIAKLKDQFDNTIESGNLDHQNILIIPDISRVLIAQIRLIQEEFDQSLNTITTRLDDISSGFLQTEPHFRNLNQLMIADNDKSNGEFHIRKQKALQDQVNNLEKSIEKLITDVLSIKERVKEVILSTVAPQVELRKNNDQNNIINFLSLHTQLMDFIESSSLKKQEQSSLINLSNQLFDEIVESLKTAKTRYSEMELMTDNTSRIISGLDVLSTHDINNNYLTMAEKKQLLDEFKKTYSMQSERINHDQALEGKGDPEGEIPADDHYGEVEFF